MESSKDCVLVKARSPTTREALTVAQIPLPNASKNLRCFSHFDFYQIKIWFMFVSGTIGGVANRTTRGNLLSTPDSRLRLFLFPSVAIAA
jgi:hypothetical protein